MQNQPSTHGYDYEDERAAISSGATQQTGEPANHVSDQPNLLQWCETAVRNNPLLAVTAVAAVGALTVMALKPRAPSSKIDRLRADVSSHAADLERQLRPVFRNIERQVSRSVSGANISGSLQDIAAGITGKLASLDSSQLEPLRQMAKDAYAQVAAKVVK